MIATAIPETTAPFSSADPRQLARALGTYGHLLLCGEPGTGRETLGRAIHAAAADPRAVSEGLTPPFVVVDCASAREPEAALSGAFFRAQGGTLFLRSLQRLPAAGQTKLARVLRERRLWNDDGTTSSLSVARMHVIASIDAAWESAGDVLLPELGVQFAGHLVGLPPLRHRRTDIPVVARAIADDLCRSLGVPAKTLSPAALKLLGALTWRGNFNELRAVVQSLVTSVNGRIIRVADVLARIHIEGGDPLFSTTQTLKDARERFEREHVLAVLQRHHGRISTAARVLGLQRTNLYRKMRQLGIGRKPLANPGEPFGTRMPGLKEQP